MSERPTVRLVPLGGLGEIGMNCMGIEHGDDVLVVDCGITFPDHKLGVDTVRPRFDWIVERRDRLRAILITHGHEDHIGALPALLRAVDAPVYGPPYALALIRHRLEELDFEGRIDLRPLDHERSIGFGRFEIEPYRVHHSIPDCLGLVIRTEVGNIVHTGDFKIEANPSRGQIFDRHVLERAAKEGIRLLLSDSTNVDVEGESGEESRVLEALAPIFDRARGRIVIGTFASNAHRLAALVELAYKHRRKVCLLGRSMRTHARIATELGLVGEAARAIVPPDRARRIPRDELVVLATGSQGEEAAALSKLARGVSHDLELEPGDIVVLSSRVIPGSERVVHDLVNTFERNGIEVAHRRTNADLHVSGHACRGEQRAMIELCAPEAFMPVHGTFHHLSKHAALAREVGVGQTIVVENGAIVELTETTIDVVGRTRTGRVQMAWGDDLPDEIVRDRALLAELGIVIIAVPTNRDVSLIGRPSITSRGYARLHEDPNAVADAADYVARELRGARDELETLNDVRERAARSLKRYLGQHLGRKPLVQAVTVLV
jgi:ribonuclease J